MIGTAGNTKASGRVALAVTRGGSRPTTWQRLVAAIRRYLPW